LGRIKPSQNPNTLPPYEPSAVVDVREDAERHEPAAPEAEVPAATEPTALPASATKTKSEKPATKPAKAAPEPAPAARVKGTTTYLDEPHKAYLRQVAIEGLSRSAKIDVSSSAVIRFALDRVIAEMTAEQVYEAIAAKPVDPKATGRKRR